MSVRLLTVALMAALASVSLASPASAQLGSVPAKDWIPTLDSPERVASMKIPELIAALEIRAGETIADVGSGPGVLTGPLANATGPAGVVYASDVDRELLNHVEQRMKAAGIGHVTTVLGTFTDPKLPGPVDLIVMNDVLHHVADRAGYVKSLAGYLETGGRLAIIDFHPTDSPHTGQADLTVTESQTEAWLRDAGLTRSARVALFDDRYFLIYRKP
jgi:2-polyprenyl-3-methyl-5-hydroxy-6-metoxy-1,4-benzoquinol methylase